MRLLIISGVARAVFSGRFQFSFRNRLDLFVALFGAVAIISSIGHESNIYVPSPLRERCGLVLDIFGSYLYGRSYMTGPDFTKTFAHWLAIILVPFGALMAYEQVSGKNAYTKLGARSEFAGMRNDRFRAKGPFQHAILAGTAAAAAIPFMLILLRKRKLLAIAGVSAGMLGVLGSASSGPVAALGAALFLLYLWKWRYKLGKLRALTGVILLFLNFAMSRPIWFLIARIDIVGGSTGWHRSKLIDNAINNLDEWWLWGTDYTRHWMHSGVSWNPNHTDITNYYLQMGVLGGLPLMLTFIAIIVKALFTIEKNLPHLRRADAEIEFDAWCFWVAILTHCVSFISIAYFDQSYANFFLLIGAAPGLVELAKRGAEEPTNDSLEQNHMESARV